MATMGDTYRICQIEDLESGTARRFDIGGHRIAVVRIGEDVYAIGDRCTHADFSLSDGEVDADSCTLECWKHGSTFSLLSGKPLILPATVPVPVYDVELDGDDVLVVVP
jgi:3-phenylpropionate/trans-cinnamate dioxygenase ferredoxin subunit